MKTNENLKTGFKICGSFSHIKKHKWNFRNKEQIFALFWSFAFQDLTLDFSARCREVRGFGAGFAAGEPLD
jgi:hypothetical protein